MLDDFERFSQVDDVFNRAFWDPEIATERPVGFRFIPGALLEWRNAAGFGQRDYASEAAWHVVGCSPRCTTPTMRDGFLSPLSQLREGLTNASIWGHRASLGHREQVATVLGPTWLGSVPTTTGGVQRALRRRANEGRPLGLDEDLDNVIVVGPAMDPDLVDTVPSALSGRPPGSGTRRT
ncbi:MAG: hypothetical protein Ct9H300mP12_05600 [Acidimicrobiales bacterium]|nr:MAG: hypothetical protein Ct9H300mP12_05600 [Acidimicrobiales bacterium]